MKKTCIKRKSTVIMSFTLLILVLSKNTLVIFVKTKPEHGKWRKHDNVGAWNPFSHLLSFAYGLYMTTATLLNGHLYNEDYLIPLILCIPVRVFHLSLSRTFVLKCCLLLSTAAYIHLRYRILLII